MGGEISQFSCIDKEGALLRPRLVAAEFPEFKEHVELLIEESKDLKIAGVLAFSSLKKYKYDKLLNYQRRDALVYCCKKVSEDEFRVFVYTCLKFEYGVKLDEIEQILKTFNISAEKMGAVLKKFRSV